jgi:serine/threonine protein kinase
MTARRPDEGMLEYPATETSTTDALDAALHDAGVLAPQARKMESWPKVDSYPKVDTWPRTEGGDRTPDFGPYRVVRPLPQGPMGDRWLAVHNRDFSSHVVHRFAHRLDRAAQRKFAASVQPILALRHAHILAVQGFSFTTLGNPWLVTPFTGNHDGLLTLSDHIRGKGGRLAAFEVQRATSQMLHALAYAHGKGVVNGGIKPTQILVDRHGSLSFELFGLGPALSADATKVDPAAEVRDLGGLAYRMLTGCRPRFTRSGMLLPPSAIVPRLDRAWDGWLGRAVRGEEPIASLMPSIPTIERLPTSRLQAVRGFVFGGRRTRKA